MPVTNAECGISFVVSLRKLLNEQSRCRWFETQWLPCDIIMMGLDVFAWSCKKQPFHRSSTHITMASQWARWRPKSPASRLFTQPIIQVQIKENIKAPRHWPLCGEFTDGRWIPRTNDQGPVLLTFLRHVARISANGIAAFKESCSPIG